LNGINSELNFMKIYQAVKKLLVEHTYTHIDSQRDWWFDKPTFIYEK
jgi:hypothetical protein